MEELLDRYIQHLKLERNVSAFTLRNYSSDITGFFGFLAEDGIGSLDSVDHFTIRRYLSWLLQKGVVRGSISRKMSALRSFFRYLNQESLLSTDPMRKVSAPKGEKRLPSFLTSEEVLRLLSAPDIVTPLGMRDLAILEMLYAGGLRVSEVVLLDVGSLDLESGQVRVWGKGSKERIALIGRPAVKILQYYLDSGRPRLMGESETKALFLNRFGNRIAQRRIQYLIKKYAERAGISERVHPHMLRHTFATHMLDGGADLRVVQELLGHTHLSSTQIYTHVTRSQMRSHYLDAHPRSHEDQWTVKAPPSGEPPPLSSNP